QLDGSGSHVYLKNPKAMVPGTAMNFPGLPKDSERADIIAYLNSLSDSPAPFPEAAAAPARAPTAAAAPPAAAPPPAPAKPGAPAAAPKPGAPAPAPAPAPTAPASKPQQ